MKKLILLAFTFFVYLGVNGQVPPTCDSNDQNCGQETSGGTDTGGSPPAPGGGSGIDTTGDGNGGPSPNGSGGTDSGDPGLLDVFREYWCRLVGC